MKENLKLGVTLLIITAIAGLILAFAFDITRAPIEARKNDEQAKAMKVVLDGDAFKLLDGKKSDNVLEAFEAKKGGNPAGYVFKVTTSGYGGEIKMLVGIDADSKVSGIEILSLSETPGLGTKVKDDPSYLEQFKGKSAEAELVLGTDIKAISGATISSTAVTNGVNTAIEFFNTNLKGAK